MGLSVSDVQQMPVKDGKYFGSKAHDNAKDSLIFVEVEKNPKLKAEFGLPRGSKMPEFDKIINATLMADDALSNWDKNNDGIITVKEAKMLTEGVFAMDTRYMDRDEKGNIKQTPFVNLFKNAINTYLKGNSTQDWYDNKGQVERRVVVENHKMKQLIEYENGKAIVTKNFDKNENLQSELYPDGSKNLYNEHQAAIEKQHYDADGNLVWERLYDKKDKKVLMYIEYNPDGTQNVKNTNLLGDKKIKD